MQFKKIVSVVAIFVCLSVLLGTASAVQPLPNSFENAEYIVSAATAQAYAASETQEFDKNATYEIRFIFAFMREDGDFGSEIKKFCWYGGKYKILSQKGYYSRVRNEDGETGYIFTLLLREKGKSNANNGFSLNRSYDHVYAGANNNNKTKALNTGSYSVTWKSSDTSVFTVDSTGLITGVRPGTATLSVTCNGKTKTIPIYCIYQWKSKWTGKANKSTVIYKGTTTKSGNITTMPEGATFTVGGDDGGTEGFAYGVYKSSNDKAYWGFVKIEDISKKGTVSQYNSMGWTWPVLNNKNGASQSGNANYISSPYAPRSDSTSTTIHHRGMDITTGTAGEIHNYTVVSAYSGEVDAVRNNIDSCGYCISITTDDIDPVSGKNIEIIYMHLSEVPKDEKEDIIRKGKRINKGDVIGKVGNTNDETNNSMGYHLHFEANNQNASVGESGRSNFETTINPICFYMSKSVRVNISSEAIINGYGMYWYNHNKSVV